MQRQGLDRGRWAGRRRSLGGEGLDPSIGVGSRSRQGVGPEFRAEICVALNGRPGRVARPSPRCPRSAPGLLHRRRPAGHEVHRERAQLVDRRRQPATEVLLDRARWASATRRPRCPRSCAIRRTRSMWVGSETNTADLRPRSLHLRGDRPAASRACCGPRSRPRSQPSGTSWSIAYSRATAASVVRSPGSLPPVTTNASAIPDCHSCDRVVEPGLEHGRRPAVVLGRPEHDDRVGRPLLVAGRPAARSGRPRRAVTTATARPETMNSRTRSPRLDRVRPRGTSCTSAPIRTSMVRCARSARRTA